MSRVFVTGDIHGEVNRFVSRNFPEGKELTEEDYVIICGDFGLVWHEPQTEDEKYMLDWLTYDKPWTTLFVDGNHENHVKLNSYPVTEWHGGKVHMITPTVIHLMRGQVFDIDGHKWFTYGGAESTDKAWRTPYRSWWPEETPSFEDYDEAVKNLREVDYKVDGILTHAMPEDYVERFFSYRRAMDGNSTPFQLYDFKRQVEFRDWYCGHYHVDLDIAENFHVLYNKIVEVKWED